MRLSPTQIARVVVDQATRHAPQKVVAALGVVLAGQGQLRQFPLIRAAIRARLEQLGLVTIETVQPLVASQAHHLTEVAKKSQPARLINVTTNQSLGDGYRISSASGVVEVSTANTLRSLANHLEVSAE